MSDLTGTEGDKMKKEVFKAIVAAVLAVALAVCITACRKTGTDEVSGYHVTPCGKIRLQYYEEINGASERAVNAWVNSFRAGYPDVTVQVEYIHDHPDFQTSIAARSLGDVVSVLLADVPQYVSEYGALRALDVFAEALEISLDDVDPTVLNSCMVNGRVYAAPCMSDRFVLKYNRDLVKAAGLADPVELEAKNEWTWDVFKEYCRALTFADESGRAVGCSLQLGNSGIYIPFMEGFGGHWYDREFWQEHEELRFISDEHVVEGIQEMISLVESNICKYTISKYFPAAVKTEGQKALADYDAETEIAFNDVTFFDFGKTGKAYEEKGVDWNVVSMPRFPVPKTGLYATGFAVFGGTRNQDAAAALCLSIVTREGQSVYCSQDGRTIPCIKSLAEGKTWRLSYPDISDDPVNGKNYDAFIRHPEDATAGMVEAVLPVKVATIVNRYMSTLVPNVVNGTKDLTSILTALETEANEALKEINDNS